MKNNWQIMKLRDVVRFENGKAHENFISIDGKYIVVNSKFISTDGSVVKRSDKNLSPLSIGDIAMVMSDIPKGKALAKCFLVDKDDIYTLNQRICALTPIQMDSLFLYYVLNRNNYFIGFDSGVGQTNLRKGEVLDCPIQVPPQNEQEKIAEILSSIDIEIQKTDQIIQKIELLNKGIIIQLLDNSSTLTVKLNTVCSKITDGTHRTPKYIADGIPFLRINDIQNDQINWERCKYISEDEHKELIKRCKPEKGDVLLSKNGTIGITKVVDWEREFSIFVSLCLIKPDRSKVLPEYLAEVVGSDYVMNQVRKRSKQGTVTNLHLEEIRDFDIPLPDIDRQKEVITVINDLKLKKVKEETSYQSLIKLKNGIMQDIFSQKVQIN